MGRAPSRLSLIACLLATLAVSDSVWAAEPQRPSFRFFTGRVFGSDREFVVTEEIRLPLLERGRVDLSFVHQETTPFIDLPGQLQTELLRTRDQLRIRTTINRRLRLSGIAGYEASHQLDGLKHTRTYTLGFGLDSGRPGDADRFRWSAVVGTYVQRENLDAKWWTDLDVSWRPFEFRLDQHTDSPYVVSIALAADVEATSEKGRIRGLYQFGPSVEIRNRTGNRFEVLFQRYLNDDHPFYGAHAEGWLLGANMTSSSEGERSVGLGEGRRSAAFPLWWGAFEVGAGKDRRLTRVALNLEMADFQVVGRTWTGVLRTETRQERRSQGLGTVAYILRFGVQARWPTGLSMLADNDLTLGIDVLHRSDHARDPLPDDTRGQDTRIGHLFDSAGLNVAQARLQTTGWDLPHRDELNGGSHRRWPGALDFLLTAGIDFGSERGRGLFAGQIGINWDIATLGTVTPYARGIVSHGNQTPDWLVELGARKGILTFFFRGEDYGFRPDMGSGAAFWFGIAAGV